MIRKYAMGQVLGTCKGKCGNQSFCPKLKKFASTVHRAREQYRKIAPYTDDYRFIRTKAIGNIEVDGPNNNEDAFPYHWFEDDRPNYGYRSFVDKKAFQEHQSDRVENSIGYLPASYLNSFLLDKFSSKRYADLNSPERLYVLQLPDQQDGSIEVLMAVDAQRAPRIARQIEKDEPLAVSMGCNIAYSTCSTCGNLAHFEHEYCHHIKYARGALELVPADNFRETLNNGSMRLEWLPWVLANEDDIDTVLNTTSNRMVSSRTFENNHELSFFELSVVANPAYHKGYKLEKVAREKEMYGLLKVCEQVDWSQMSNDEIEEFVALVERDQVLV